MTQLKRSGLGFALAATLVLALPALAGEKRAAPAAKRAAAKKYQVYDVSCRRLVLLIGSYDSASEACSAAALAQWQKKQVEIVTDAPGDYPRGVKPAAYSVYGRLCKSWNLAGRTGTDWQASLLAGVAKGRDLEVQIIHHFAAK